MNAPWAAEAAMNGIATLRPIGIAEQAMKAVRDAAARNPKAAQLATCIAGGLALGITVTRVLRLAQPHIASSYWHARDYVGSLLHGAPAQEVVAERAAAATASSEPPVQAAPDPITALN